MPQPQQANQFKPITQIRHPDSRNTIWTKGDRRLDLFDYHEMIATIKVSQTVDEQIKAHIATAKNCLLYSWFSYPLTMLAIQKSASTLELSLKLFLDGQKDDDGKNIKGYKMMLRYAHQKGYLQRLNRTISLEAHISFLINTRNDLAHGSNTLITPFMAVGSVNAYVHEINTLFDYTTANQLMPNWGAIK